MVKPIDWGGMLSKYVQPLKERASVLPLGQYEDGSIGLAWPGLLADPVERGYQAANSPIPPVNDDAAWADKSAAMFDMTSLAPIAGAGVAMTGALDNALGSAGGNLMKGASDIPMDLASRMARAKEMGFDTDRVLYHGTHADFDEFQPSTHGNIGPGVYATNVPDFAGQFATSEGGRTMPIMARGDFMPYSDWMELAYGPRPAGESVSQTTARVMEEAQKRGFSGVEYGGNNTVAIFDPRNIRSVNAAFDPSKSDSANLLAANSKDATIPGLLANVLDEPQGIRAYHGTATVDPITQFRSGMKGDSPHMEHDVPAIFFSTNPRVADEYASSTGKELANRISQEWRAAGKSEDEIAQLFDQRTEADKNTAWKGYIDKALSGLPPNVARVLRPSAERYGIDVDSIAQEFGPEVAETMRRNLDLARSTSDYFPDYSAVYPVNVGGNLKDVDAKIFGGQFNGIVYDNLLKEAKAQGFDGLRLRNVVDSPYGTELESDVLAMFNPGHVRSATTGDLLYSNAPTGSLPSLAAQTQEQDPQTLTTANILRFLRGQ